MLYEPMVPDIKGKIQAKFTRKQDSQMINLAEKKWQCDVEKAPQ